LRPGAEVPGSRVTQYVRHAGARQIEVEMYERAELRGGKLAIWSKPDAGTEIELTIPAGIAYAKSSTGHEPAAERASRIRPASNIAAAANAGRVDPELCARSTTAETQPTMAKSPEANQ